MSIRSESDAAARRDSLDPSLLDTDRLHPSDAAQSFAVMEALGEWQEAWRALAKLSAQYMRLNETDMRAIRMIMGAQRRGEAVTPKDIARAVDISPASTTKLIDRLVAAGHLTRSAHPTDRRTTLIRVTESTRRTARDTIGRQHARRFAVAAAMTPEERETVIGFFKELVVADQPQADLLEAEAATRE
ncbi:MarR family winged helix-turn-helix transcriptional regulator [Leucobacter sp.]